MTQHEWLLKRNCSMSPRQLATVYAMLCATSFAVAVICALRGAWYVLAFSILEMTAVALAFVYYARHASDREHIALIDDCLLIERIVAGKSEQIRLERRGARIGLPSRTQDLINLHSKGVMVGVGRFVNAAKRRQVALELLQQL